MAFIDACTIYAQAGDGGSGVVRWKREKYRPKMGPGGGNGGRGGDVRMRAVPDLMELARVKRTARFQAPRGEDGSSNERSGKAGESLVISVPVGSVVRRVDTGALWHLTEVGQEVVLLQGGAGGFGNAYFKSAANQAPKEATPGEAGERAEFFIELWLIADAGFVGLPSAGKSSLLNTLTGAHAKVGNYPFTTLTPHLGVMQGVVLADIPGLIKGASEGKGLGLRFLQHVRRTKLLLHTVSLEHGDVRDAYDTIRHELETQEGLAEKPEIILLTKADLASEAHINSAQRALAHAGREVLVVSLADPGSLSHLRETVVSFIASLS